IVARCGGKTAPVARMDEIRDVTKTTIAISSDRLKGCGPMGAANSFLLVVPLQLDVDPLAGAVQQDEDRAELEDILPVDRVELLSDAAVLAHTRSSSLGRPGCAT